MSVDPHNELHTIQDHYIGIDVGTGSARACIMNDKGDIVGLASENIGLWQPETGYYVSCLQSHWKHLYSHSIRNNPLQTSGDASAIRFSVP
jgi:ribulose kinase